MREDVEAAIAAQIRPDERIEVVTAMTVERADGAATFALFVPLVALWRKWQRRSAAQRISSVFGIPATHRSLLVLTDARLLFWRRGRRTVGPFIGELPRASVTKVTTGTVGRGWRTCEVYVAERYARVRVVGSAADELAAAFPGN